MAVKISDDSQSTDLFMIKVFQRVLVEITISLTDKFSNK